MSRKPYYKMNQEQKQKMFKKQIERRKNPNKKPKSITISYRLTPFVIGRALDGLWSYNGNFEPHKMSQIIKEVFFIGLNNITEHLENGKISDNAKAKLLELSNQIYMDDMENVTTRTNEIKNSNPNNCNMNLFKQQTESLLNDRGYK